MDYAFSTEFNNALVMDTNWIHRTNYTPNFLKLPSIFPTIESLQTTGVPLEQTTEAYRDVTIARLKNLKSLNHTTITPMARTNAELTQLSMIGRSLSCEPGMYIANATSLDFIAKIRATECLIQMPFSVRYRGPITIPIANNTLNDSEETG